MTAPIHDDRAHEPEGGASRRRGAFAVRPQAPRGRAARLPVAIVAIAIVAVVGLAVVGGQLGDYGRSTVPAPADASLAGVFAATATAPDVVTDDHAITLDIATLRDAVASGGLAGTIVVVNGRIASTGCEPQTGCDYSIIGMPGRPVILAPDLLGRMPFGSPFDERAVRPYAFRVRDDGVFVVLGVVGAGLGPPETVDELAAMAAPSGQLVGVSGWLWRRPAEASAAPAYVLRGSRPPADPTQEQPVGLEIAVPPDVQPDGVQPSDADTFLVARTDNRWRVEGQYGAIVTPFEATPEASAGP